MGFELTQTTKNLSNQLQVKPVLILEIDGLSLSFGTDLITRKWFFDEGLEFDSGLFFDGVVKDKNSRGYIQEKGTTNVLTSQVEIDEGGTGSVQKFNINLIDKDGEVSRILTPGNEVSDPLSREANVYISFQGGAHPLDSVRIFTGLVTEIKSGAGAVSIGLSHPDQLKRQSIFEQNTAKLDGAIDDSQTTITLKEQAFEFIETADTLETYITLEDEIIKYTSISGNDLLGCVRGSLNTIAVMHDSDVDLSSLFTISGNPIDIALKLMLSNRVDSIASGSILNFNQISGTEFIQDTIFIEDISFLDKSGIENGELISITGSINPANDVIDAVIVNSDVTSLGTTLTLDTTLITETDSTAEFTVKSQYNVFPDGLGMSHSQVDLNQHQTLLEQYGNQLPEYLFYLKETVEAKDFLAKEVYFPAGLYSLIRKGRSSVQITVPPLNDGSLVTLDSSNVKNPDKIQPIRSANKYFYNNVTYKYNQDSLENKFLKANITLSARSNNRISLGNKPLLIESCGLRDNEATDQFIVRQARRFTERFQFAAEKIIVDTNFKTGFNIEVGDAVLFGDSDLKIYDITSGTRDFKPRLMEVINKSFGILNAKVQLTLLDTAFSSDARYGTISPNSLIDTGSTTSAIKIKKSFSTGEFTLEREKWEQMLGETIRIRNEDFTFTENVTLISFDLADETIMNVYPALSVVPSEDYLVDLPRYNEGTDKMKSIHCFTTPQVNIVSGTSITEFVVDGSDTEKFFIGGFIRVHNEDFTVDSTPTLDKDDLEILDVQGNNIIVDRDMGFIPSSSEVVSLVGFFSDKGVPYRYT